MGTSKNKYALLWAKAQLQEYGTEEIVKRLYKFRTFYVLAWEKCLETGEPEDAGQWCAMIGRISSLLRDIEQEKMTADVAVGRAMVAYPLMIAPAESLDFAHLLDDDKDEGGGASALAH